MSVVYMYDAVNLSNIPSWAAIVAAYVDGLYDNFNEAVEKFPHAYHVSITVKGQAGARVADCENGDLTPAQAAQWAKREIDAGRRPTIYCAIWEHDAELVPALTAVGLQFGRDLDWWAAGYDASGAPYLAPGSVATQYAGGITAPYDISETNGVWPVSVPVPTPPIATAGVVGIASTLTGKGYWVVNKAGAIGFHGDAGKHGSLAGVSLKSPIVGISASKTVSGYWLVASDGGVFSFNVPFHGSTGNIHLTKPIVGITSDESNGYWLVASDGGIFSFGTHFYGSLGNITLNKPIVGMTGYELGYWLVGSDGGIFNFGSGSRFFGSTGNRVLAKPIVGMALHPSKEGYWLVAADGGVFSFGDARFFGSTGNVHLTAPVVGMSPTPSGNGYWLVASDGGVFSFGDAAFYGAGA